MGVAVVSDVDPWFTNTDLDPSELRYAMAALLGRDPATAMSSETGVLLGGPEPFAVTQTQLTPNPIISVVPGACVMQVPSGGTYVGTWNIAKSVNLTAAAGNPRIDVLCARVRDNDVDASGFKSFELLTVDGVAAASPSAPAIPAGYLPLWECRVATNGAITLTDRRKFTRANGGVRYCPAAELSRAGSHVGDMRVQANGQIDVWVAGAWLVAASPAVWTSFTPTLFYSGTSGGGTGPPGTYDLGVGGSAIGRYIKAGKSLHLRYAFRGGTSWDGGTGVVYTRLPSGITSAIQEESQIVAKLNSYHGGVANGIWIGTCHVPPNDTAMYPIFPSAAGDVRASNFYVSSNGSAGTGLPNVPGQVTGVQALIIQGTLEIQ